MATVLPNLDNPFTQQFGQPTERVANKVKDVLPEPVKDFIRQSPFIVMATSNREGWCDAHLRVLTALLPYLAHATCC
jgi:predicted pyridoxine 5'-phosphate oxidase superfamily flavin-nucleotide-binding protein